MKKTINTMAGVVLTEMYKFSDDFHNSYEYQNKEYIYEIRTIRWFKKWDKPLIGVIVLCVGLIIYHNFHV